MGGIGAAFGEGIQRGALLDAQARASAQQRAMAERALIIERLRQFRNIQGLPGEGPLPDDQRNLALQLIGVGRPVGGGAADPFSAFLAGIFRGQGLSGGTTPGINPNIQAPPTTIPQGQPQIPTNPVPQPPGQQTQFIPVGTPFQDEGGRVFERDASGNVRDIEKNEIFDQRGRRIG